MVKRLPEANGKNSRNRAPSTGRFPPTPNPRAANRPHAPIQLGAPPAAIPNTPHMKRLKLKAGLRPIRSEATPQKEAPQQRPTNNAQVVNRMVLESTPNSGVSCGRQSATPCSPLMCYTRQRLFGAHLKPETMGLTLTSIQQEEKSTYLSASQPKPHKTNSCH